MEEMDNIRVLQKFVQRHHLKNPHGQIIFSALVSITTAKRALLDEPMTVQIVLDGYQPGVVTPIENELDPYFYPTKFIPNFQKYEHVDNVYLSITDTHKQNPDIGKYEVKIIPIGKSPD